MPWLRSGDNAGTNPLLLTVAALDGADERLLNEVSGWLWRCATQSAGHTTDGRIDAGTAALMAGPSRLPVILRAAIDAGLITPVEGARPPQWQIVEDPAFLHIRSKESIEFEQQRDRDRKNPDLTAPVRLRDGDACRYCGNVVNFSARTGGRSGTYDHTDPGTAATVDTYVVCCRSCNGRMKDGQRLPLLSPPSRPYFAKKTLEWLHAQGLTPRNHRTEPTKHDEGLTPGGHLPATGADTAPGTASDPEPAPPAPAGASDPDNAPAPASDPRPSDPDPAPPAPAGASDPDTAPAAREALAGSDWVSLEGHVQRPGRSNQDEGWNPGTGRDGTGRGGTGRGGAGADPPQRGGGRRRRRKRRGGRGSGGGDR
ncbi:HNH endonuclease [Serinicoccus sediminis]|uniref:HNH endonuclease n=1 Tax=Serinicoccus sediminis TaxID=2306021 RepID=UPI001020F05A|nr:hypothetical protein [Serinicoccus sediminis]